MKGKEGGRKEVSQGNMTKCNTVLLSVLEAIIIIVNTEH